MIKLRMQTAQNIVDRMMEVVPYNVNIMDENGVIIGSGDTARIGKLHEGALEAIQKESIVSVYEELGGSKPGVNIPIYINKSLMGVIGISGDPDIVKDFASIVKVTAELLIGQEYLFNEKRVREQVKEEFLYQWAYLNQPYDENFIQRASSLDIDLAIKRIAVVIKNGAGKSIFDRVRRLMLETEYIIRINPHDTLIFMKLDKKLYKRIDAISEALGSNIKIGVGLETELMSKSLQQALKAIEIKEKLEAQGQVCSYSEVEFIDILSSSLRGGSFLTVINKLLDEPKGVDLVETLMAYAMLDGEIGSIADALHIHRNSLNYRLRRIEEITGKNPRKMMDFLELAIACILYKLKGDNCANAQKKQ